MSKGKKREVLIKGYDACPDCGCKICIGTEVIQELKDDEEIPKQMFTNGLVLTFPLYDPKTIPQLAAKALVGSNPSVPSLRVFLAICKDCKRLYLREVNLRWQEIKAQVQMQQQQKPPGKFGPAFGRG